MATIRCYSQGKQVKVIKNVNPNEIQTSPLERQTKYQYENSVAIDRGFTVSGQGGKKFEYRGDFLVEY